REAGGRAEPCRVDVTRAGEVDGMVAVARERFGRLDVVIHCAGILRQSPLETTSEADWQEVLAGNPTGAVLVAPGAPASRRGGGGWRRCEREVAAPWSTWPRGRPSAPRQTTGPTARRRRASSSSRRWRHSREPRIGSASTESARGSWTAR